METNSSDKPNEIQSNSKELQYFQKVVILEKALRRIQAKHAPYLKEIGMLQSEIDELKYEKKALAEANKELTREVSIFKNENQQLKTKVEKMEVKVSDINALRKDLVANMKETSEWKELVKRLQLAKEKIETQKESINNLICQLNRQVELNTE